MVFYGQNPDPIDLVEKMNCPFLGDYGGEDAGLNASLDKLVAAMVRYKKDFEMRLYPGAPHVLLQQDEPCDLQGGRRERGLGEVPRIPRQDSEAGLSGEAGSLSRDRA